MEKIFLEYGAAAVFGGALIEFIGIPFPSAILLLYVGAISKASMSYLFLLVVVAAVGAVLADLLWYGVGRKHGHRLLDIYCKISLGTESCTDRTTRIYSRFGVRSLLFAKFVPGFSTFASPMAGHVKTPVGSFLLWDAIGSIFWSATLISCGYIFGRAWVDVVNDTASEYGSMLTWIVVIAILIALIWKVVRLERNGPGTPEQLQEINLPEKDS